MSSFNNVVVVGNLTRDPDTKTTAGGMAITELSLAINDRVKKGDDYVEEVSYFDVTVFGRTAEVSAEYLNKGSKVLIHGRLKQDRWENEDGEKRQKVKIIANNVQFMDPKNTATAPASQEQSKSGKDLPF
jgi:single-strand DNA-binding protein